MLAPSALFRGIVARLLPTPNADSQNVDVSARMGRYGEQMAVSLVRKQYGLADEGTYFVGHNAQTGIAGAFWGTTFAETTISPYIFIGNTDIAGGKSIYLDYVNLICTVVGAFASAGTKLQYAWTLDTSSARYTSGGTDLTNGAASNGGIMNVNGNAPKRASIAQIYMGALTLAAATASRRIILPQRLMRVTNSATVAGAVEDELRMNFGAVEHAAPSSLLDLTTAKTVGYREIHQLPAIIIPPQGCAIMHVWSPGQAVSTTGVTYLPEMAWSER